MSFSTTSDCGLDLQTDAVADKPRDVINDLPKDDREGHDNSQSQQVEEKALPPNSINCQKPKVSKSHVEPKKKQGSTPKKTRDSKNSFPSQGAGGITVNISRSSGIHVGNTIHINLGNKDAERSRKSRPRDCAETKEIKSLKQNTEPVSIVGLQLISSHVGENWKELGRFLGYSDGQLDQFKADNGSAGLKEVIFQLLLDWKRTNTKEATVSNIVSALCEANQFDAVEAMVEVMTLKPTKVQH